MAGKPRADLLHKMFGKLYAAGYAGNGKWECHCGCLSPDIVYVDTGKLLRGEVTHCGCAKYPNLGTFKNLTGKTFGDWEAVEYVGKRRWKCRCKCGLHTEKVVATADLLSGKSTGCGHKHL